jgi:hypothetical protein
MKNQLVRLVFDENNLLCGTEFVAASDEDTEMDMACARAASFFANLREPGALPESAAPSLPPARGRSRKVRVLSVDTGDPDFPVVIGGQQVFQAGAVFNSASSASINLCRAANHIALLMKEVKRLPLAARQVTSRGVSFMYQDEFLQYQLSLTTE